MKFFARALITTVSGVLLAGCGVLDINSCEKPDRYQDSSEIAPVQVPEGLSPPDESRALQIPDVPAETKSVSKRGDCLESPPEYFEDS